MKRLALIAATVLVGGWLLVWLLGGGADEEGALAPSAPLPARGGDGEVRLEAGSAPESTVEGRAEVAGPIASEDVIVTEAEESAVPDAVVHGFLLHPDDAPAVGVEVVLESIMWSNADLSQTRGEPPHRESAAITDATGRFDIDFVAPPTHHFTMRATTRDYAEVRWRWGRVPKDGEVDVGVVRLRPTGAIEGFIVDESGVPIPHAWLLRAVDADSAEGEGYRDDLGYSADADPHTGGFRIEGLPAGTVGLSAVSQVSFGTNTIRVEVPAHGIVRHDLPYRGQDPRRTIQLRYRSGPFSYSLPDSAVRIHGERYDTALATSHEVFNMSNLTHGTPQIWFEDLPPGRYTVTVTDEHFESWSRSEVSTGESVGIELQLRSGVRLTFDESAIPVDEATLATMTHHLLRQQKYRPKPDLYSYGALPSEGTRIRIPPGNSTLVIERPGCAPTTVVIDDLDVAEVRDVTVVLPHP